MPRTVRAQERPERVVSSQLSDLLALSVQEVNVILGHDL